MTATVIPFKARTATTECQCPKPQLDALAGCIRVRLEESDALLIPRDDLAAVLDDLAATTDRLIPPTEQTKP